MKLRKNIISFNGDHGSGKSTIAKVLAEKIGYKRFYMGRIFRDMAREHEMSYSEFLDILKTDSSYDKKVDDYVVELSQKEDNFIIESRTAWHFIPESFKIYLKVSEEEGIKRIFSDYQHNSNNRNNESKGAKTLDDIRRISRTRKREDDKRYQKTYGIDVNNMDNYDLVLDTTDLSKEEVFERVENAVKKFIAQNK